MPYPPLVSYEAEAEYRSHYEQVYCQGPITTFDNIKVRFRKNRFEHCFFESTKRNRVKDKFSGQQASRIDWIKAALQDQDADLYVGWDSKRKQLNNNSRVAVVVGNYIVIIRLTGFDRAEFVTAYVADSESTISRIIKGPRWGEGKKKA